MGIGVAVGAAAVVLTAGLALPALAVIAGAAVVAGGTVALGTMGLNAYYERPWNENLARNITIAEITAVVVTGAWFLFQTATTVVGSYCALNTTTCARVEPILNAFDIAEEGWLSTKLGFQTWIGNDTGAVETAFELQLEHIDGGMPGNSIAKELGGEALEIGAKYGDEALDLIKLYGVDAVQIISKYGDEGIAILQKYGDEGIALLQHYGDDAIEILHIYGRDVIPLLKAHGVDAFRLTSRLTPLVGEDAFKDALAQGPEAVAALSHWTDDELIKYGDELVARAATDAKALDAAFKLAKIKDLQSPEAKKLLKIIAENSIQGNADRLVIGKWVDGSFDEGFIGVARADGSSFYGPNRGLEKAFDGLSPAEKDKYLWAVNQQALQQAVDSRLKIDYSFDGLDSDFVGQEIAAIEAIASGNSDEVLEIFGRFPFRMREVEFLVKQGYIHEIDTVTNMIHLIKP